MRFAKNFLVVFVAAPLFAAPLEKLPDLAAPAAPAAAAPVGAAMSAGDLALPIAAVEPEPGAAPSPAGESPGPAPPAAASLESQARELSAVYDHAKPVSSDDAWRVLDSWLSAKVGVAAQPETIGSWREAAGEALRNDPSALLPHVLGQTYGRWRSVPAEHWPEIGISLTKRIMRALPAKESEVVEAIKQMGASKLIGQRFLLEDGGYWSRRVIYVLANGLYLTAPRGIYRHVGGRWRLLPNSPPRALSLVEEDGRLIAVTTDAGGVILQGNKSWRNYPGSPDAYFNFAARVGGKLYFGTEAGLYVMTEAGFRSVSDTRKAGVGNVYGIFEVNGRHYLSTKRGLFRREGEGWRPVVTRSDENKTPPVVALEPWKGDRLAALGWGEIYSPARGNWRKLAGSKDKNFQALGTLDGELCVWGRYCPKGEAAFWRRAGNAWEEFTSNADWGNVKAIYQIGDKKFIAMDEGLLRVELLPDWRGAIEKSLMESAARPKPSAPPSLDDDVIRDENGTPIF